MSLPSGILGTLRALPDRLSDAEFAIVKSVAAVPIPQLPAARPAQFETFLAKLTTLPRKADDGDTGEERVKVYARMLGHLSPDELGYLARTAIETCRWLPTVAECLDILKGWKRNDDAMQAIAVARRLTEAERAARFDDLCQTIGTMSAADIDALPERTKAALENRCLLWRLPSGRFVLRPCRALRDLAPEQWERMAA